MHLSPSQTIVVFVLIGRYLRITSKSLVERPAVSKDPLDFHIHPSRTRARDRASSPRYLVVGSTHVTSVVNMQTKALDRSETPWTLAAAKTVLHSRALPS